MILTQIPRFTPILSALSCFMLIACSEGNKVNNDILTGVYACYVDDPDYGVFDTRLYLYKDGTFIDVLGEEEREVTEFDGIKSRMVYNKDLGKRGSYKLTKESDNEILTLSYNNPTINPRRWLRESGGTFKNSMGDYYRKIAEIEQEDNLDIE